VLTKRCTGCRKDLPANPEHFWRNCNSYDGLCSLCKDCHRQRRKKSGSNAEYFLTKRQQAAMFRPLVSVAMKLVADLEAAKTPDKAYRLAKEVLAQVKEQGL